MLFLAHVGSKSILFYANKEVPSSPPSKLPLASSSYQVFTVNYKYLPPYYTLPPAYLVLMGTVPPSIKHSFLLTHFKTLENGLYINPT